MLHNLHKKYARKNTTENQQAMAILKAGKLEHAYENQKRSGRGEGLLVSWLFLGIFIIGKAPNLGFFLVIFAE